MAKLGVPHFHNDLGLRAICVGAREFMCMGAKPPFDHPHVFLDMGHNKDILCPYCSTVFVYDGTLAQGAADPPGCLYLHSAAL